MAEYDPPNYADMSRNLSELETHQDELIDQVHASVITQKHIAQHLGETIDEQAPLIDEMLDKTNHENARIKKSTEKVQTIKVHARDCISYIIIAVELVLLIVTILLCIFL